MLIINCRFIIRCAKRVGGLFAPGHIGALLVDHEVVVRFALAILPLVVFDPLAPPERLIHVFAHVHHIPAGLLLG